MLEVIAVVAVFSIGVAIMIAVQRRSYLKHHARGDNHDAADFKSGLIGTVAMWVFIVLAGIVIIEII